MTKFWFVILNYMTHEGFPRSFNLLFWMFSEMPSAPSDPVWSELFQQSFQEKFYYPVVGTHYTNGTYYYDYTNRRYRVDRDNGRYDRYCGFNGVRFFQDTPCTQLVIDGVRWMIYPGKQECCDYVFLCLGKNQNMSKISVSELSWKSCKSWENIFQHSSLFTSAIYN